MTDRHCHNTEEQDPAESEQVYLIKVITAFASYKRFSLNNNHRRRRDYLSLPEHHKKLIPDFLDKVNKVDECIEHNMTFIRDIVKSANMFLDPKLDTLFQHVPADKRGDIRVLVPGAGLGRLAFDIASQAAKETSFLITWQLFGSHFILNRVKEVNEYSIYPFIHSYSNIKSDLDQLSPINVPDVLPAHLPSTVDFSMVAGDFVEVYGQQENNF
ncbi:hypothetical protein CU097_001291, partial [Rhizopus azygosporus]